VCRHLAYLGPEQTLASVVLDPAHSLLEQASEPCHQVQGRVNADGFGVGWWAPGRDEPVRHRRAVPIWADRSFADWAPVVRSGSIVAAVRSATAPYPVEESCAAPFSDGRWLFSLNGSVTGGAGPTGMALRATLRPEQQHWVDAPVDSALVFALVRARLAAGADAAAALAETVREIDQVSPSRLNLLLCDGRRAIATSHGDSLFVRRTADSVTVASEPHGDEQGWEPVPDDHLVDASPGAMTVTAL